MKVTIVVDNIEHAGIPGEWGFCAYIEQNGKKLLLDTGASNLFADNAEKLNIDLKDVDFAVLSHAHYDHANGMEKFFEINEKAPFYLQEGCGENCYFKKGFVRKYIGIPKGITMLEHASVLIFCIEYALRIWTADYLYPEKTPGRARFCFLISFDGVVDLLTIIPVFFLSGFIIFRMLRVARIFHLFRLNAKYDSFNIITTVLYEKRNQIISSVFIVMVLMLASSMCMYSVEHNAQPDIFRNAFSGFL